jgi:PAT family beta-lactamase induction signal transducer AmpG
LRALSENAPLRFGAFTALYMAQGLPYGLFSVALPAHMAEQGFSPTAIGSFIGLMALPWSLKLINGPIMDRWTFLPMGRRRPWVLAAQAGMVLCSMAIAVLPGPLQHFGWLSALAVAINFCTAFQDVAVDGMAVEIVPIEQQARANGFMWGGKTIGIAAGTVGGAWLINAYGLDVTLFAHAAVIALVMLIPLLARERAGERLLPWTDGAASAAARQMQLEGWSDIGRSLFRVFVLPVSIAGALAIFAHNVVRGLHEAMLPVVAVQELGWTDTGYAGVSATANLIAGLVGMMAGGWLVERLGRQRVVLVGALAMAGVSMTMGLSPGLWTVGSTYRAYVSAYLALDTLITIAFFAILMAACWKRVAATQFSLYMAVANMGMSLGAALVGPLHRWLQYSSIFFVVGGVALTVVALIVYVDVDRHRQRVNALDDPLPAAKPTPVLT